MSATMTKSKRGGTKGKAKRAHVEHRNGKPATPAWMKHIDDAGFLHQQLCILDRLIDAAYPENHRLRRLFTYEMKHEVDNYRPPLAELQMLWRVFWNLPQSEQRRILNGWRVGGAD